MNEITKAWMNVDEICNIIRMWLHDSKNYRHFGFLEIFKKKKGRGLVRL